MAILILTGLVSVEEGLSGFSNEATFTVALMLVLSAGLLRTGTVDLIGRWIGRLSGDSEGRLLAVVLLTVVPISAFLNNTAVVAILVPTVIGLSRTINVYPSRVLMPLSFASQMGGSATLIGTSTNLLVAGLVLDLGLERIRIFDITPPALILAAVGVLYLLTIGRWLTPHRSASESLLESHELREYLTSLLVEPGSRLAGQTLGESRFGEEFGLQVVAVERGGARLPHPTGSTELAEHDILLVLGKIPDIAQIEETEGLRITGSAPRLERKADPAEGGVPNRGPVTPGGGGGGDGGGEGDEADPVARMAEAQRPAGEVTLPLALAEVMVPPSSHLIGHTLKEIGFRARFGVSALAIQRHGHALREKVGQLPLLAGDILLVQGSPDSLRELHEGRELTLLGPVEVPAKRKRKRRIAVVTMIGVVLLPALGVTTILVSALVGALVMILTGCVTPSEVYEEMDWSVIVLLGSILPLGIAMQRSGTAELLAGGMLSLTEPLGAYGALAAFYLLTAALTAVISNAASAVVLTPMAVASGAALGVSPLPFVIAVMIAASNSYLTPIGYQTNVFVYGPGGYRFGDFARVGGALTVLSLAVATYVIPLFFPFHVP